MRGERGAGWRAVTQVLGRARDLVHDHPRVLVEVGLSKRLAQQYAVRHVPEGEAMYYSA